MTGQLANPSSIELAFEVVPSRDQYARQVVVMSVMAALRAGAIDGTSGKAVQCMACK